MPTNGVQYLCTFGLDIRTAGANPDFAATRGPVPEQAVNRRRLGPGFFQYFAQVPVQRPLR